MDVTFGGMTTWRVACTMHIFLFHHYIVHICSTQDFFFFLVILKIKDLEIDRPLLSCSCNIYATSKFLIKQTATLKTLDSFLLSFTSRCSCNRHASNYFIVDHAIKYIINSNSLLQFMRKVHFLFLLLTLIIKHDFMVPICKQYKIGSIVSTTTVAFILVQCTPLCH